MTKHIRPPRASVAKKTGKTEPTYPKVRQALARFTEVMAARMAEPDYNGDFEGESQDAWDALGEAIVRSGFALLIAGGKVYSPDYVHPEQGKFGEGEYLLKVFPSRLVLDLDAEATR